MTGSPELDDFLPYVLNRAAETTSLRFERVYKDTYGMLRTEWRVLFHLGRYGSMTAREICDRSGLHKTKVSRAIKSLEERRFLTRHEVEEDRRHERIDLTAAGTAAYHRLSKLAVEHDRQVAALFTEEEMATLRRCLNRLRSL